MADQRQAQRLPRLVLDVSSAEEPIRMVKGRSIRGLFQTAGLLALASAFLIANFATAAEYTVQVAEKAPPKEVAESIRAVLQSKAVQLKAGDKAALELWLRQEVPLKSKPSSPSEALGAIGETTLVGALSIAEDLQDYKGNDIPKGIYTARLGLQPQDGDHLGTADFPYFMVLIPADSDKDLNGIDKFRPMVKASGKAIPSGHPAVLSLRPASAGGKTPSLNEPLPEHKAVRVEVPGKTADGTKASIVFDLVYRGKGHA